MSTELANRERQEQLEAVSEQPTVRPAVDIYENKNEYLILADLPAVKREDLNIHLAESQLTIEGTVSHERAQPHENAIGREFQLVNYRRTFDLPEHVDRNKVEAQLKQGVLTLHLPKTDAVKPRQIEVRAG